MHRHILHNGVILDSATPCLKVGQVGLLAGWGVFSTLRVCRGVLFAFDRHYARMCRDAENMRVPMPDAQRLRQQLLDLVRANGADNCTLRVVIIRNTGSVWAGPSDGAFDVLALTAELTTWGDSVRLGVVPHGRYSQSRFAGAKVTSWGANLTFYEEAHSSGYDEVVLLNENELVTECTSANIFAVYGRDVRTPPLSSGCLPGVTRELLLGEIQMSDIDVAERDLRLSDLESADEVFITSTTRDLLPVLSIDGLSLRGGSQVCHELRREFRRYLDAWVDAEQAVEGRSAVHG